MQDPQHFSLGGKRHVSQLVEEQRALVRLLEFAYTGLGGTGEASFFMAEEFTLQEAFRNGGTIDGQKGVFRARAVLINGASHQFLACAAFSGDQDGGIGAGQLTNQLEDLLHGFAPTDDAQLIIERLTVALEGHWLTHVLRSLESLENEFL